MGAAVGAAVGGSKGVAGSASATATFPAGSGFIGTTLDFDFSGFWVRAIGLILPLLRGFTCLQVGVSYFGCRHTILLLNDLHDSGELRYTSPVRGLDGTIWGSHVSDAEAAAALRANPNFEQGSLTDSDEATAQTVRFMCDLVKHSLSDPIIGQAFNDAWNRFRQISMQDEAACCWWYAKYLIKFVHHQELLRDWLFSLDDLQLLISPEALLKMQAPRAIARCSLA